jgi:MoaA/NifB/PqqE/SkfB family radical SAM enzyme
MREIHAEIIIEEGKVWLRRVCPEHGVYRFLLSNNGLEYADLDRFFFDTLEGRKLAGRITNYWVFLTSDCQQKCPYCSVNVKKPFYSDMNAEDFAHALKVYGNAKFTFSGGEPTMHPACLDFFRKAQEMGVITQLATNGLKLVDMDFCRQLKDAGVSEVRISYEYWNNTSEDRTGTRCFREAKRNAIENCLAAGIPLILSPTIMKGCNEEVLLDSLEFAADHPLVKELSVNGFSWNGSGKGLDKNLMIMPDEMVDVIHERFGGDREAYFTFAKVIFAALYLCNIRICMNTQILVFIRQNGKLRSLIECFNQKRMKRGLQKWSSFSRLPRVLSMALFVLFMLPSFSWKTIPLIPSFIRLFLSNIFGIKISKYPTQLLPVVLNTNCSPLNADNDIVPRCMSGNLFMSEGRLTEGVSALTLRNLVKPPE